MAPNPPDELTPFKIAIRDLLPGGMEPEALLQLLLREQGQFLLSFAGDVSGVPFSRGTPGPANAASDERVQTLTEILGDAIDRVGERSDIRLLQGILGLAPETQGLRLRDRRAWTAVNFRGPAQRVTRGTLRTHFEPGAIKRLCEVLLALSVDAQQTR